MNIQWYPGHMTKTRRMIADQIKYVDAVCEILDSRIPVSSRNPDVDELTAGKPRLVVLMLVIFRQMARFGVVKRCMPLVLLVYIYMILGTVETTFSMSFLLWLALIFMLAAEKQPAEATEERGVAR